MINLTEKLPKMLREVARQEAYEGEYDETEHIDWMAAARIEELEAENKRLAAELKAKSIQVEDMKSTCEFLHETEADNDRLTAVFKRLEERLKYIDPVALDIAREALAAVEEKDDEI